MKKNIMVLALVLVGVIASILIIAQKRDGEEAIPPSQVNDGIQTFARLLNDQNLQSFGLKSIEQLKALKPGKQFNKYMIGLNDIKAYKTGDDPGKIIKSLPVTEVSLVDDAGKILTSIEFTKTDNKWQASGFGLTADLTSIRTTPMPGGDTAANKNNADKVVMVPALHTSFIAVDGSTGLNFIVLENNENLNFRKGAIIPAGEALTRLAGAAAAYNGLPQ